MIISWCIITKGDEELGSLKRSVASVIDHVDEMVITTNGEKTEKTVEFCKKDKKIKHYHLPWNDDFSEQRNFCASKIRKDTDYYGWSDSDDVVVNAHLVREVARIAKKKEHDAVFFTYWYGAEFDGEPSLETFVQPELNQMRERLLRPGKTTWKKRIHETPVPFDGDNYSYTQVKYSEDWPVSWLHLGADRDIPQEKLDKRMARNRRLLEKELADERDRGEVDPRTVLYLMKVLAEEDDEDTLKRCIDLGHEYLEKSGWDQERSVCYKLMATCMGKMGNHEKARDFLHGAIKEFHDDPLLYLHLARAYFNLDNYSAMKHWIDIALGMQVDKSNTAMNNVLEMKIMSSELLLQYFLHGERNIRKAYEAAKTLNRVNPTENNEQNEEYLYHQKELDIASEHAHKLMQYLVDINREDLIESVYEGLPDEMKRLPFAYRYYNRYKEPKVWKDNEICYFANFGQEHHEKWDGNSIKEGIGGSETAVIRLAEEWTKEGWDVTVYGDPKEPTEVNGVRYLPYYMFNQRDKFNIFIQWRHNSLAKRVNAKKYIVDLHDVTHSSTYMDKIDQIDKIAVKSKYHRGLLDKIPDSKFMIISNGI